MSVFIFMLYCYYKSGSVHEVRWPGLGALFWRSFKVKLRLDAIDQNTCNVVWEAVPAGHQWSAMTAKSRRKQLRLTPLVKTVQEGSETNHRLPKSQIVQCFLKTPPSGSLVLKEGTSENLPTGDTLSATSCGDSNDTGTAHRTSNLMLSLIE